MATESDSIGDVVLVTGGAGFLGQHIVKLLQQQGSDVREIRVFDRICYENKLGEFLMIPASNSANATWQVVSIITRCCTLQFPGHVESKPVRTIVGDIAKAADVMDALRGVDCVIHTAGVVSLTTFPEVDAMKAVNVKGTVSHVQWA